jgi:glycosyltransferase involved in cell wall biosynthesis
MRIGLILPSIFMYPKYGQNRIFAPGNLAIQLADGLVDKGHTVNFYSSPGVSTKAHLVEGDKGILDEDLSYFIIRNRNPEEKKYTIQEIRKRDYEYPLVLKAYQDAKNDKLDIIHNYHDFAAHYFNELTGFPTVYTLHDPMPPVGTIEHSRLSRYKHHNYISISDAQRKGLDLNFVQTIYHGVDFNHYSYGDGSHGYLIFFGRMLEDKGPHIAISVAKKSNTPLKIASSFTADNTSGAYYEEKIKPFIDGKFITQIGFMEEKEKSEFIGKAKAFIFPLQWEEPFGMVLIESMACGTPVIAYDRGSVREIVEDGVTGFVVDPQKGEEGLLEALSKIGQIDREKCREFVMQKFSLEKMVQNHEELYKKILSK